MSTTYYNQFSLHTARPLSTATAATAAAEQTANSVQPANWRSLAIEDQRGELHEVLLRFALGLVILAAMVTGILF